MSQRFLITVFPYRSSSALNQPSIEWVDMIHKDWTILEKHLPETVFVRVDESRMNLLRAVIIGPQGTPYRDGLFFFDLVLPGNYILLARRLYVISLVVFVSVRISASVV
uniref:putative ubiquitin-conjugating enzyme E2 39 n=1 Tax=Erigeron canadensis TaxID=72917 RepID=UPI001CB988CA|nr:putative ubiquitin-conjugating enzyme E2 39 [Erigeron canadensis]